MPDNVFNEKKDFLLEVKRDVEKRDSISEEIEKLRIQQKKITKNIASEEKSIADEIASTLKKRKQEIADTYDDRLDDNRARKKKVSNKRDKKKTERMKKRMEDETMHIKKEQREYDVEIKTLLRKNRVPSFCSSKLYFIMFMPSASEIIPMILAFLAFFVGVPGAVTLLIRKLVLEKKTDINMAFWCVLIMAVFVIIQLIIYFAVYNSTKNRHQDTLTQARSIMDKMKANDRQVQAIKSSISKDKDESAYDLGAYDTKLKNLDEEADAIGREKQEALRVFEEETKKLITDEINGRRLQAVEDMKAEKKTIQKKISDGEKEYSEMVLKISNQYASYIGEEFCKEDKLADLIAFMEDGQAETVSEAISIYKGQKASK